jgi:hypothetical protein
MRIIIIGPRVPGRSIIIEQAQLTSGELVRPEDAPMSLLPLMTAGVDGVDFQEMGRRPADLSFITYRPSNNFPQMESQSASLVGQLVSLRITDFDSNAPYGFNNAVITSVRTVGRSGKMHGVGAITGVERTLIQSWVFSL